MTRPRGGFVSLVGAGPGDPELLTRKAARVVAEADLVLYDALVDPDTLALAPAARRVFVGKRAGRPHVGQAFIHRLMVRAARRGQRVVRLKGGDPFVFGRGGEEALALTAAGIPFEVIPGVSAAIAAATLANIPVTHRGIAAGFVVVSGHAEEAYGPILETLAPNLATVVVMMGLGRLHQIAGLLIERGWNATTPVAVIVSASTPEASAWTGTLGACTARLGIPESDGPGTILIGDVVKLRGLMAPGRDGAALTDQSTEQASPRVHRSSP